MRKGSEGPLLRQHPKYGPVYHVGSPADILEMVRRENGQSVPDTSPYEELVRLSGQGSRDRLLPDPRYLGAGWKAMPADLSTLRQGVRAFKLLDDMNNWGLPKRLLAETDMFAIDQTSEIYAHMNANYVRINELPSFDNYGRLLDAVARGDYFISMGEVLLPKVDVSTASPAGSLLRPTFSGPFPLAFGEIIWSDGDNTFTQTFPLDGNPAIRQRHVYVEDGCKGLEVGTCVGMGCRGERSIH